MGNFTEAHGFFLFSGFGDAPDGRRKGDLTLKRILLGNEAIARGLLENGCSFLASYPGTPASEILSSFVEMAKAEKSPAIGEWSINEKVAFETALTVSYTGGRAAVSMKQVGLNVACDPLMSSAYTGVKGGFLVIPADDPGPHSSQTEQDSRMMAMMAKIPVLDPSTPQEAKEMISLAYQISEEYEIPVRRLRNHGRSGSGRSMRKWPLRRLLPSVTRGGARRLA